MSKFNVGDKVKVVDGEGTLYLHDDEVFTVQKTSKSGVVLAEKNEVVIGWEHYYQDYRFELAEPAPTVKKKVSIKGGILTISYEGVSMTFDTSNEKSRMMVDAVIDAIYGDE
jgi:hypothetical protein